MVISVCQGRSCPYRDADTAQCGKREIHGSLGPESPGWPGAGSSYSRLPVYAVA